MRIRRAFLGFGLLAFASCDAPPEEDSSAQVAAELRALRMMMVESPSQKQDAASAKALILALAPLRDAVQTLVHEQGEQQQRQVMLGEELTRWTHFVVQNQATAANEQTAQLTARIKELGAEIKAQELRHKEVEAVVQKALDATATKLDAWLQSMTVPAKSAADGAVTPTKQSSGTPYNTTATPPQPLPTGEPNAAVKSAAQRRTAGLPSHQRPWLYLLLAVGFCGSLWLLWRIVRVSKTSPHNQASTVLDVVVDAGTETLWASVQGLGENERSVAKPVRAQLLPAVAQLDPEDLLGLPFLPALAEASAQSATPSAASPLRHTSQPAASMPWPPRNVPLVTVPPVLGPSSSVPIATVPSSLEPYSLAPSLPFSMRLPDAAKPAVYMPAGYGGFVPMRCVWRLSATHPAALDAVQQRLNVEPRILQKPAPSVRWVGDKLEVECALVPSLPAGDVAHVRFALQQTAVTGLRT
ncbi:MAG: hypothetical protein NT107_07515 [Planctomycetota bacterium]|nr:hypothetical protein [Planctomycetota bacterium]